MSFDLNAAIGQLCRDKGIDKKILIEAVESAVLSAAKKHFGHNLNLESNFNEDSGEVEVLKFRTVVERVEDSDTQISLSEARAQIDAEAEVGDELGEKLPTEELGRIAAQTAKQVILQKLRDAERGVIYEEYKNSKGELVNGIVQRYERGSLYINLGRTEAIIPKREQISRERYRQGDRIRCMILDIDPSARGPQIILTRSHPDFIKKLFSVEVPEIAEGTIEIRAVAREPGERAKIAVYSNDTNIDPVGACVGIKGSRVQAVVQELKGERVDIITWIGDDPSFVVRALAPAEVTRVVLDEDTHSMEVIVADDQLPLAIGRRGQNVKLASKLTGWRLDVRSISVAEEEAKRAREALSQIPGMEFTFAEILYQHGYRSIRDIAQAELEEILSIEGFSAEVASTIYQGAKEIAQKMDEQGDGESSDTELPAVSDLDRLALSGEIRGLLIKAGISKIQDLALADNPTLMAIGGIDDEKLAEIRAATDSFLKGASRASPRLPTLPSSESGDRNDNSSI